MDEYRKLIQEAFGESSEDSDDDDHRQQLEGSNIAVEAQFIFGENPKWERISEIKGLSLCRDFLTSDQQSTLLASILQEGWFSEASHNQAMRFGDLPAWAKELSTELLKREPLFNQLIVNSYQPGEGICAHVDLMRFEDGIALVSLESSCVMHFSRVHESTNENKIPVYLTPGSLLLISGEARYEWKHEINRKPGFQKWDGLEIRQKKRTSITLRKLCKSD
ncbi:unnamed protein product [Lactuca virosa]|uniref:Fe2OG dioxygenase domain-containing protein n=1 Tax=Lactuca virosa TaxID=75947 RepID=A0AAU9PBS0_9ASTR|nr:unnamed protein product [Lactuca virosa]